MTFAGAVLVSHAAYSSRQRRNSETQKCQAKSLKHADRLAKSKLMAQPEIGHALEQLLEFAIHASHQIALLQDHSNVFFCSQCGAVNAGGSLRLLKSQRDGSGGSRRKARRKRERGLMPCCDARRAFLKCPRNFFRDDAGCLDSPCTIIAQQSSTKERQKAQKQSH